MIRLKNKIKLLEFDWDKANKYKNLEKHKVEFKECEEVFFNKPLKTYYDIKHSQTEDRFVALGITNKKRKLHIVFTVRENKIRIISARSMSRKERNLYEER